MAHDTMQSSINRPIAPGTRVRIEQRIMRQRDVWTTAVEGEVVSHEMEPTGSWYARRKKNKLWLPRLRIRKPDGEISAVNLDGNSKITILGN